MSATLRRLDASRWRLDFDVNGPCARLRDPPPAPALRTDGLWQYLCGELFVAGAGDRYAEFNFSPSGAWAAYRFDGWRQHLQPADLAIDPQVRVTQRAADRLSWSAEFVLPQWVATAPWRVAPCAVLEHADGERSYWALAHGAERPDFHREESFVAWVNA